MYFGPDVQEAIQMYNSTDDYSIKNELYHSKIYYAMNKLVENIIHDRKYYDYGDLNYETVKLDCVAHLTQQLSKFDKDAGKAFSFFNRCGINHLLALRQKIQRRKILRENLLAVDVERDVVLEITREESIDTLTKFCRLWADWGIANVNYLYNDTSKRQIAESVFNLFKNVEQIELFNKKALYIMIREQVDVPASAIRIIITDLQKMFYETYEKFIRNEEFDWNTIIIPNDNNRHVYKNFALDWIKWLQSNNYNMSPILIETIVSNKKIKQQALRELKCDMYSDYLKSGVKKWKYYDVPI